VGTGTGRDVVVELIEEDLDIAIVSRSKHDLLTVEHGRFLAGRGSPRQKDFHPACRFVAGLLKQPMKGGGRHP
jgi:hypothetical protein